MTSNYDRREAMGIVGAVATAAALPAAAQAADKAAPRFVSAPIPAKTMFPQMQYFEVDSVKAGARYAVWITTPPSYDSDPKQSFPVIYTPDGNYVANLTTALADVATEFMETLQPTIQVAIGYVGKDAPRAIVIRGRDLVPPHEPMMPGTEEDIEEGIQRGMLDRESGDLYLRYLRAPAADRFLAFIIEELHPFIASRFRVQSDNLGLMGHSYGGLFALYAALQPTTIFRNFAAFSPGIIAEKSEVFKIYREHLASGLSDRNLHMTVCTREFTDPTVFQSMIAAGSAQFMKLVGSSPMKGLSFTSKFIENETHGSTFFPSAYSFLRTLYQQRT